LSRNITSVNAEYTEEDIAEGFVKNIKRNIALKNSDMPYLN